MRSFLILFFFLMYVGMMLPEVALADPPLRMTVSPAPGDVPSVTDNVGQPCHVTKSGSKDGVCRLDSACIGNLLGVRPSSCIQSGAEEVLCCFAPNVPAPAAPPAALAAGGCNGGGRNGTCLPACAAPGDLIAGAAGCAAGESCCAAAVGGGGGGGDIIVPNPIGFTSLEAFLTTAILPWFQGVIVTLALVFFIIGALLYMTGGASESNIRQGKAAMTAALIGFAIALAAPMFLKEIYSIFGVASPVVGPTLVEIALNVLKFLLSIIGILGTILLVVSGLAYMGSAGADDKAKSAKKMATAAVIGIALALAALILIRQITKFFL